MYDRLARPRLEEALSDTPAVLLHGPRQAGKTTLAKQVGEAGGYGYVTFDDDAQRAAAEADPAGFVARLPERVVLDEIQRVPTIFTAIKSAIDTERVPGRFLLTGSANVLVLPRVADSLAGRMEALRLLPLAQHELERSETKPFVDRLFERGTEPFSGAAKTERLNDDLIERVVAGGYPAALERSAARRRAAWYRNYAEALVQRDVLDLASIRNLGVLPRLLAAAAAQTASLSNISELASPFEISRPTVREYVTLLTHLFLVEELPPWRTNRLSRLVKRPKLHLGDTGLASALLDIDAEALRADRSLLGHLAETFVFSELLRQATGSEQPPRFFHYRDRDRAEVDLILARGERIAGVEVKSGATVRSTDFRALRKIQDALGERLVAGIVVYDGEAVLPFGEHMWAVPYTELWR